MYRAPSGANKNVCTNINIYKKYVLIKRCFEVAAGYLSVVTPIWQDNNQNAPKIKMTPKDKIFKIIKMLQ